MVQLGTQLTHFCKVAAVKLKTILYTQPPQLQSGLGGLVVSMLASGTQDRGFEPSPRAVGFFRRKNPQHAFLWRGSKAACPMSQVCAM
jgi:hypothetical protein